MDYKSFKIEIVDNVATVFFNRPKKANSLDIASWREMKTVFDNLSNEPKARVIILRGEGKHFCAGMDLQSLMGLTQSLESDCEGRKREHLREIILEIQETITAIERCSKPVIAAIHNGCIGGALSIISACDMRYCTDESSFVLKEIEFGFVADIGALQRLPKIMNPGILAELSYSGRTFHGKEAAEMGLVNRSFGDETALFNSVKELAQAIAAKSPLAVRGTKANLLYARDHSVGDSLDYMATWNASRLLSSDVAIAMQASFSKSTPTFED